MARPRKDWRPRLADWLQRAEWEGDCLIWAGALNLHGYGQFVWHGLEQTHKRQDNAHRVVWEAAHGPVPKGWHVDHTCSRPACVNIRHLEAVPSRTNTLRGIGPSAKNARKDRCKRGHPLRGKNLYRRNGRRHCRACRAAYAREQR